MAEFGDGGKTGKLLKVSTSDICHSYGRGLIEIPVKSSSNSFLLKWCVMLVLTL